MTAMPLHMPDTDAAPRSLACLGDSGDVAAWSGIPYFLFKSAGPAGFLTHTMDLMDPDYVRRRRRWLLRAPLRLERPGGYQYSHTSAQRMWEQVPPMLRRGEMLSHFQLFPPLDAARSAGVRHSFYCDATLRQLFDAGESRRVGRHTCKDALRRERDLYQSARFYIGMSRAAVESAVGDYGVDPSRAFVVRPGANLDEEAVLSYLAARGPNPRQTGQPFSKEHPAQLGWIGKDWKRKGLPRLIGAAQALHRRGRPVRVAVIGTCPQSLARHPLVDVMGTIDKRREIGRFIRAVDGFSLGCLPSYSEPLGIATLEALRLGVPVMGTATGGIPDCVPPDAGFLVASGASDQTIADAIEQNVFDPPRYAQLVEGALRESPRVTWDYAVYQLLRIWEGKERPGS